MKTYIIYLAAGNSRRFKEDKLHALFKGKELYLYGIDTLKQLLKYRNDLEIIVVSNTIDIQEKYIHKLEKVEELKSGILKRAFENELIEAE